MRDARVIAAACAGHLLVKRIFAKADFIEYSFGLPNFRMQLLLTAMTAAMLGLSFSVVILPDYPYRGDVSITPERWVALHAQSGVGH